MDVKVRYSYLPQQFANSSEIFTILKELVAKGDFTLGQPVEEFEQKFSALIGTKYAIGVGSGTDALKLPLRALGVTFGDEVITTANTFIATVGAINETGARPVLVDCDDSFCMDLDKIERAITKKTKAIMPVQFTGNVTNMTKLMNIAEKYDLPVIEDACQGILSEFDEKRTGTWGIASGFSLHPLKNLNVWGDAGIIVTDDQKFCEKLRLLRNHGLKTRDEIAVLGYNSRLDSIQAVVGNWLIGQTHDITNKRIANAAYYDKHFSNISGLNIPKRQKNVKHVFHLYMVFAKNRDKLYQHCIKNGVEAKIHYPIPLYQQEGLRHLGYKHGDFPVTDQHAKSVISFPVDQHISRHEQDTVIQTVREFYA